MDGKLFKLKTPRSPAFANLISQATPTIIIIIITHRPASLLKKLSDQKHIILLEWPKLRLVPRVVHPDSLPSAPFYVAATPV